MALTFYICKQLVIKTDIADQPLRKLHAFKNKETRHINVSGFNLKRVVYNGLFLHFKHKT